MRKDRFSALLMANAAARRLQNNPVVPLHLVAGGIAGHIPKGKSGSDYTGPDWFVRSASFGGIVQR
jgi:hypothetical protein